MLIHSGTAHVRLGDQERDLHVGSMVFIPANTWVGLKNTSAEVMSITFVFSAPGFDDYLRCTSVPAGEKPTPMTQENWQQCRHEGHALFEAADGTQKSSRQERIWQRQSRESVPTAHMEFMADWVDAGRN